MGGEGGAKEGVTLNYEVELIEKFQTILTLRNIPVCFISEENLSIILSFPNKGYANLTF